MFPFRLNLSRLFPAPSNFGLVYFQYIISILYLSPPPLSLSIMCPCLESYQLSSNVILHSCYFTTPPHTKRLSTRAFLYCARNKPPKSSSPSSPPPPSSSSSSSYSYQIVLRRCEIAPNGSFILGQSSVLLDSCPPLDFVAFKDGICFLPCRDPYPKGLLLFWAPGNAPPYLYIHYIYKDVL